jgi:hypothetical protein
MGETRSCCIGSTRSISGVRSDLSCCCVPMARASRMRFGTSSAGRRRRRRGRTESSQPRLLDAIIPHQLRIEDVSFSTCRMIGRSASSPPPTWSGTRSLRTLHCALLLEGGTELAREFWLGHPIETSDGSCLRSGALSPHLERAGLVSLGVPVAGHGVGGGILPVPRHRLRAIHPRQGVQPSIGDGALSARLAGPGRELSCSNWSARATSTEPCWKSSTTAPACSRR